MLFHGDEYMTTEKSVEQKIKEVKKSRSRCV